MRLEDRSRHSELVYSKYTLDNLEYVLPKMKRAQAEFEDRYGFPTDIDKVWADREANQ